MNRTMTALVLWLGLPLTVAACLWDRDTPADEARGMPEVVAVLTGRFPRNPPLYYEMRLDRVAAHLRDHPDDFDAYDDAGVACDRLGRGDEAVGWMGRKRARLAGLDASRPEVEEHWYRYHANFGTFLIHRWLKRGADLAKIDEVKAARAEIAEALRINPNAHFGREAYQLHVIDWIINPPKLEGVQDLPNLLGWSFGDIYGTETEPKEADGAVRGLAGLVVLGNAWESVDIFHALNVALQRDSLGYERGRNGGRNTLAYFAWLRCRELIDAGKGSLVLDTPKGDALKALMPQPGFVRADLLLDDAYQSLRTEADAWQAARAGFMFGRLKSGRHPDTDSTFWDGYKESPAPGLPTKSVPQVFEARMQWNGRVGVAVLIGVPALMVGAYLGLGLVRSARRRRLEAARLADRPKGTTRTIA